MKHGLFVIASLGFVTGLEEEENRHKRTSRNLPLSWGEPHRRDSAEERNEKDGEESPYIVLPSTSNKNVYSLTDLPENNDWGLVEIDRDFDLLAEEYNGQADNLVYSESPFKVFSPTTDRWKVITPSPVLGGSQVLHVQWYNGSLQPAHAQGRVHSKPTPPNLQTTRV